MTGGGQSGSGSGTSTQVTEPWSGAKPYILDLYKAAQDAYSKTPKTAYAGSYTTPVNNNALAAQAMMAQFIPGNSYTQAGPGQTQSLIPKLPAAPAAATTGITAANANSSLPLSAQTATILAQMAAARNR